jgi:hypothetical protein
MSRRGWWMGLLGTGLALVGVWGAWVPHRAAALVLSGWDLAEYLKFVPGASATRELFYLPVWCAAVALGIAANLRIPESPNPRIPKFSLRRTGLVAIALALMVAILPPYPDVLKGYQSAEFRWQFILGVGGALVVLASLFSGRLPARVVGGLLVALALVGAIPALWQFLRVRGAIEAVYGASLGWGWGLGPFLVGWGLVGVVGGRALVRQGQKSQ